MPKNYRTMRMPTRPPSYFSRYPPWDYYYGALPRTDASLVRYGASYKDATPEQRNYRAADRMYGSGMYMGGPGSYGKVNRLKKAGRWAGFAGDMVNKGRSMMGMGSYKGNSLIENNGDGGGEPTFAETVPSFATAADETGAIVISHKEYITDVYGNSNAGSFTNTAFTINPGLERTFPWLAQLAANFEEYEFKQLIFSYRSLITQDNSSTGGQVGTIILATNYNVGLPQFSDKATMMQYAGASSCRVTDSELHGVECDPAKLSGSSGKYTRVGPVLVDQDAKNYDWGLFQLGISGTPAAYSNLPIGELWVSYTITCRKPKLFAGLGSAISTDYWAGSTGCSVSQPFGTSILKAQQNNIGTVLTQPTANTVLVTFPATFTGVLRLVWNIEGVFTTAFSLTAAVVAGGCTRIVDIPVAGSFASSMVASSLTSYSTIIDLKLTTNYAATSSRISFTTAGVATSVAWSQMMITEMNELNDVAGSPPVLVNSNNVVVSL